MHEFSAIDGFMEVTKSMGNMIKYIANEPSMGLFYVQQHAHNAIPNVTNMKNNIDKRAREISLAKEDLEDSIPMVKTMKECGPLVAGEMIEDIKSSLALISKMKEKKGLTPRKGSGFLKTRSWGASSWSSGDFSLHSSKYFTSFFRTAKEKASSFDSQATVNQNEAFDSLSSQLDVTSLASLDRERVEIPLPNQPNDDLSIPREDGERSDLEKNSNDLENFDDFTADKEAKLVEWLEEPCK